MSEMTCVQRHQVMIADRGGGRKVAQLRDVGEVSWRRTLNGISQATVRVSGEHCRDQASTLAEIMPGRHELVIFRENERVWEGPIKNVRYMPDSTLIDASDIIEYLAGTALSVWWPSEEDGGNDLMTQRISFIIAHELTQPYILPVKGTNRGFARWEQFDPPIDLLPHLDVRPGTLKTAVETLPFQMTVAEHLSALGKSGLRYTALGRRLMIWDSADSIGELRPISEKDLGERLNLNSTTNGFTCVQHVVGQASDDPEDLIHVGSAGYSSQTPLPLPTTPYYGAWTSIDTLQEDNNDEVDIEDAVADQAARLWNERRDTKLELVTPDGGGVRLGGEVSIRKLVPGVIVPVTGTVNRKPVSARYLLQEVTVSETSKGEAVKVSLGTEAEFGG